MDTVDYGDYDGPCCKECGELGTWVADPYLEEVWGEIVYMYLCKGCYRELENDI